MLYPNDVNGGTRVLHSFICKTAKYKIAKYVATHRKYYIPIVYTISPVTINIIRIQYQRQLRIC